MDAMDMQRAEVVAGLALPEVEELPLKVVPDGDEQVERAGRICRLIDRHLDFEARCRMLRDNKDFRPAHLCPEQRVQMVSDVYAAAVHGA